uniref:Protein bric-a-brac 1-like n=2 Tax=Hirondellea gigas TaxID=1518452 RepID=A0A6A7G2W3_9CRUS
MSTSTSSSNAAVGATLLGESNGLGGDAMKLNDAAVAPSTTLATTTAAVTSAGGYAAAAPITSVVSTAPAAVATTAPPSSPAVATGDLLELQWMDHQRIFSQTIIDLRNKHLFTDVTLACDGQFYPVHKFVLATCSEFFSAMFEWTPCVSPILVINNMLTRDLEALLDFMYTGEASVRECHLEQVMKAAQSLRVRGLAHLEESRPVMHKPDTSVTTSTSASAYTTTSQGQQSDTGMSQVTQNRARHTAANHLQHQHLPVSTPSSLTAKQSPASSTHSAGNEPPAKRRRPESGDDVSLPPLPRQIPPAATLPSAAKPPVSLPSITSLTSPLNDTSLPRSYSSQKHLPPPSHNYHNPARPQQQQQPHGHHSSYLPPPAPTATSTSSSGVVSNPQHSQSSSPQAAVQQYPNASGSSGGVSPRHSLSPHSPITRPTTLPPTSNRHLQQLLSAPTSVTALQQQMPRTQQQQLEQRYSSQQQQQQQMLHPQQIQYEEMKRKSLLQQQQQLKQQQLQQQQQQLQQQRQLLQQQLYQQARQSANTSGQQQQRQHYQQQQQHHYQQQQPQHNYQQQATEISSQLHQRLSRNRENLVHKSSPPQQQKQLQRYSGAITVATDCSDSSNSSSNTPTGNNNNLLTGNNNIDVTNTGTGSLSNISCSNNPANHHASSSRTASRAPSTSGVVLDAGPLTPMEQQIISELGAATTDHSANSAADASTAAVAVAVSHGGEGGAGNASGAPNADDKTVVVVDDDGGAAHHDEMLDVLVNEDSLYAFNDETGDPEDAGAKMKLEVKEEKPYLKEEVTANSIIQHQEQDIKSEMSDESEQQDVTGNAGTEQEKQQDGTTAATDLQTKDRRSSRPRSNIRPAIQLTKRRRRKTSTSNSSSTQTSSGTSAAESFADATSDPSASAEHAHDLLVAETEELSQGGEMELVTGTSENTAVCLLDTTSSNVDSAIDTAGPMDIDDAEMPLGDDEEEELLLALPGSSGISTAGYTTDDLGVGAHSSVIIDISRGYMGIDDSAATAITGHASGSGIVKCTTRFKCPQCPKVCLKSETLAKHLETHRSKQYSCVSCEFITISIEEFRNHRKSHMNKKCPKCDFYTKRADALKKHMAHHVGNQRNRDVNTHCDICDFASKNITALKNHMKYHHDVINPI